MEGAFRRAEIRIFVILRVRIGLPFLSSFLRSMRFAMRRHMAGVDGFPIDALELINYALPVFFDDQPQKCVCISGTPT